MEKFFTPVYSPPPQDEIKPRKHKNHHHYPHDHQEHLHHPQHHQPHYHSPEDESHSYTKLDENDGNTDNSQAPHQHYHHQHGYNLHDNRPHDYHHPRHDHHLHHHHQYHHPPQEDDIRNHQQTTVTLSRASSSSLSSSSSSSFFSSSSCYTEASTNDHFSVCHAERPQHSLSCSNILEVRGAFREDDRSEPIVFATVKHNKPKSSYDHIERRSQQKERTNFSSLDRGQSRSDEGPLQTTEEQVGQGARLRHRPLYKMASLGHNLAFSEENILLGASGGPQRAVSSSQLPGKGILKNRHPQPDIRKAKSMEVLSTRVAKGQGQGRDKGKGTTQVEIERAMENFVQGKLQFSAFLDEITKQVISPSNLNILGVNHVKTTEKAPDPVHMPGTSKPQLPAKKHRQHSGKEKEQHQKPASTQEKKDSYHYNQPDQSNSDKLTSYVARKHRGSPPPHLHPQPASHHPRPVGNRKEGKLSLVVGHVARESDNIRGSHLTDGTSTSPEPILPRQRHYRKHRNAARRSPPPHPQYIPHHQPCPGYSSPGQQEERQGHDPCKTMSSVLGPESEPSFIKSDSARTRDTASTSNSQSSDQSVRHHSQAAHRADSNSHRDLLGDPDQFQALQEENNDLYQNLLQTVVCIESLEAELHRTREELSQVKDKYRSLLEMHTGKKQANNLLGEHLHIAAPCLIKELLEKHFDSTEAVQKFLKMATSVNHPKTLSSLDSQSSTPNVVEVPRDWSKESEAGSCRVTAFMPWKQETSSATGSDNSPSDTQGVSPSQSFSMADISTAIYKKMAADYATSRTAFQPQSLQRCPVGTNAGAPPADVHQARDAGESAQGLGDLTYLSAQQVLDDFMNELHPRNEASGGKEQ